MHYHYLITKTMLATVLFGHILRSKNSSQCFINCDRQLFYEGWNFNFGNIPLDWIQELLE